VGRAATNDLIRNRIRIQSLNFMRGRTFLNKYIILDEAQNLTAKQMKTLITRAGPALRSSASGTSARSTPLLDRDHLRLTYVVDRFKHWPTAGTSPCCAVNARGSRTSPPRSCRPRRSGADQSPSLREPP